ncbi:MAG: DUF4105 domain-containing protein [Prevotella sp.]|nr:DUF4105 domain-containing protein [Prevotella sp.]
MTGAEAKAHKVFKAEYLDSVQVSLLTCQPHDEVYSLYGHTALRWHDLHEDGGDIAFNWGVFNFNAPHFVARFVFGLTDYELGGFPYSLFKREYQYFGSMVTEQVLNLTAGEKQAIYDALNENLRPGNRIYRYNYFYNNCTTKARDIIEQCVSGKISYDTREDYAPSFRDMVHEMTQNNPWAAFGNDLLLGIKADMPTDRQEQEFLPNNLMYDFDHAQIYDNGQYRPLVKERRTAVPAGIQIRQEGFPLTPLQCGLILSTIGLILFLIEWKKRHIFVLWDALLMVITGTIGIVLFLMLFSQHPTVSINIQIILLNPLPWFFLWQAIKGKNTRYWYITTVLCILFFIGGLFQSYAEGIWNLALCLLLQCILHIRHNEK